MSILFFILDALWWLIMIDAVLSWVMPVEKFPRSLTNQFTEPLYAPIRMILSPERTGGFDLSPLLMLILIRVVQSALQNAAANAY
jgi:YggT family protein